MKQETRLADRMPLTERRHFIRHPLCYPLSYKIESRGTHRKQKGEQSTTINISLGGLLFPAKNPVNAGSTIKIKMPFEDKIFITQAKVVNCIKNPETNFYNIGVSFYRFKDAYKVKMVEQIYLIAEYRDLLSLQLGKQITLEEASREWIKRYSVRFKKLYW